MKKIFSVVALLALSGLALTGCETQNSSSLSTSTTTWQSTTTSTTLPNPVVTAFAVNTSVGNGAVVNLISQANDDGKYEAGTTVEFSVTLTDELTVLEDVSVTDTHVVKLENSNYSFVMPNKDTTISVVTSSLGDGSLLEIKDVTPSDVPTTYDAVVSKLEAASLVESVYAKSAVLNSTYGYSYDAVTHYEVVAGNNDILVMNGYTLAYSTSTVNEYEFVQRGLYDESHYYELNGSYSSSSYSISPIFKFVVADPEEGSDFTPTSNQILTSQAKQSVSSFGLVDLLVSGFFANNGFDDDYTWAPNIVVSSSLDSNTTKTFTTVVSSTYEGYSNYQDVEMILNFDGNGFLNFAHFTYKAYSLDDYNSDLGELVVGAKPIEETYFNLDFTRGYKEYVEPQMNPEDFASYDYDVIINQSFEGVSGSFVSTNNNVEVGATLSFNFLAYDDHPWTSTPAILVDITDNGVAQLVDGKCVVLSEGEFELSFDNGLGDIKTVSLTAVAAQPHGISFSLTSYSNVYANENNNLVVSVLPVAAQQDVTLTVDASSSVNATITENEESNSFNVVPDSVGTLTLVATSEVNPQVSAKLTLTVVEKPNVDTILNNLYTKSIYSTAYGDRHTATFYEDGTGYYSVNDGDPISFTWSLNSETVQFTITFDDPDAVTGYGSYWYYGFKNFEVVTTETFSATYVYRLSGGGTREDSMSWSLIDRVELKPVPSPETAEEVITFLTENTFVGTDSYGDETYTVTFNSDNTGVLEVEDYYGDTSNYDFTWSVDSETAAITVTNVNPDDSYTISGVEVVSGTTISVTIGYYGSDSSYNLSIA